VQQIARNHGLCRRLKALLGYWWAHSQLAFLAHARAPLLVCRPWRYISPQDWF